MPTTNLPRMNMAGWTANDCKATATNTTTLFSNIVYFLGPENEEISQGLFRNINVFEFYLPRWSAMSPAGRAPSIPPMAKIATANVISREEKLA